MTAPVTGRTMILTATGVAVALLTGFLALQWFDRKPAVPAKRAVAQPQQPPVSSLPPSLDCAFTAFMHSSTAIYFYFDVAVSNGAGPRFYERAFVSGDGVRQTYEGDQRPEWTYGIDEDSKPRIISPDGATHIVLYTLKLGSPGISTVEAGLRSNVFRNLGGQCRQTNLGGESG